MSFVYGGISTDDLEGVNVSAPDYPNMGGLTLDTVETPGRDGRYYGGSRMTTSVLSFRVTVRGENQQQADQRRLTLIQALDPSIGPRSLRLDNTANWHYPQAVVSEQIEWEKHIDRSKVIYDGTITFETNFDPAMRQIEPSSVTGSGRIEFIADMGSTVSYPTVIFESGGDLRVRVNDFTVDLYDTPPDIYGILNWDEFKFYTAEADPQLSETYRWTGTRHNSPSEYLVGGELLSVNHVNDPSFERGLSDLSTGSATTVSHTSWHAGVRSGDYGVAISLSDANTANGYVQLSFDPAGLHGKFVAMAASVRKSGIAGPNYARPYASFWGVSETFYMASGFSLSTDPISEVPRISGVGQIPEGATRANIWIRFFDRSTGGSPDDGLLHLDDWHVAVADTEQDALAQVEHYFDGDSVGHIVPGERVSSLVNHMEHFERPAIYPGQRVEVEVTPIGSNTATPVIIYPNHRRL